MKKTISIILAAIMLLGCLSVATASAASDSVAITLNGTKYEYTVGTTVEYTCNLKNASTIENGQFAVHYPSQLLSITSVELPTTLDAMYNYEENLVDVMKFNFSNIATGYDFKDDPVLVKVTFTAIANGEGEISLEKEVLSNVNSMDVLASSTFTEKITESNYVAPPEPPAPKTKVIVKGPKTMYVGAKTSVSYSVSNKVGAVTFASSNKSVATVSSKGKVTAKKAGTTYITVKNNGVSAKIKLTVKNPTVKYPKTVKVKKTAKITIKNAVGKVKFKALNKNVKITKTTKTSCTIKGMKKGTAKVKITSTGFTKTYSIKVK